MLVYNFLSLILSGFLFSPSCFFHCRILKSSKPETPQVIQMIGLSVKRSICLSFYQFMCLPDNPHRNDGQYVDSFVATSCMSHATPSNSYATNMEKKRGTNPRKSTGMGWSDEVEKRYKESTKMNERVITHEELVFGKTGLLSE